MANVTELPSDEGDLSKPPRLKSWSVHLFTIVSLTGCGSKLEEPNGVAANFSIVHQNCSYAEEEALNSSSRNVA